MKILMLSGGLDSTYLAWRMLSEPGCGGVLLHHISLKSKFIHRWKRELSSVLKIVEYFKQQGFKFEFTKSNFELTHYSCTGFDSDTILLVAQKIAQNYGNQKIELVLGWNPFDMERPVIADRAKRNVTGNIWKALVQSANNRDNIDEEIKFPLIKWGVNKDTMVKELPKELLDMTWSCRFRIDEPCGNCHACLERKQYLGTT